jgi:beta-1,4-mannosyl-glycoprotein beta-1,4-N-acetylglucosaminyltransferase
MLIDGFIFYNELDLLEFRLNELNDVVDKFIIIESTKTFSGNEKPLFFKENKERFANYLDKIIHIVVEDFGNDDAWSNEFMQRNAIHQGISQLKLKHSDLIMITDVDEIPNSQVLYVIKSEGIPDKMYTLEQDMYYYNLSCKFNGKWCFPKICTYKVYSETNDPQHIRTCQSTIIHNGGWHFSYFGDVEFIKNKIRNFSHQEYNTSEFINDEHILQAIKNGKDLFKRDDQINYTYINPFKNPHLPKTFKTLIKDMYRYDIINELIKTKGYTSYLEIGVRDGQCFEQIECQHKVGVDPYPTTGHTTHIMTSDKYFEQIKPDTTFDIIFIDGLHVHTQVDKDIQNSLEHLSEVGCIVLHDCNPPTQFHALDYPVFTPPANGDWNGSVYLSLIKLRIKNHRLKLVTVDTDWGVGILTKELFAPIPAHLDSDVNWEFFNENRQEILGLISCEEFLKNLETK